MRSAVLVVLIVVAAAGCATIQAAGTRSTERMLAAAGFHVQLADTPERATELQSLPARQLVSRAQNGAVSYVFSDPVDCRCLYIGGEREYQAYQRLRLEQQRADEESMRCRGWPWCLGYGG